MGGHWGLAFSAYSSAHPSTADPFGPWFIPSAVLHQPRMTNSQSPTSLQPVDIQEPPKWTTERFSKNCQKKVLVKYISSLHICVHLCSYFSFCVVVCVDLHSLCKYIYKNVLCMFKSNRTKVQVWPRCPSHQNHRGPFVPCNYNCTLQSGNNLLLWLCWALHQHSSEYRYMS